MSKNKTDKKSTFDAIVKNCQQIGQTYTKKWKPVNPVWPTKEGGCYLRLSTDEQVLVDHGSLEQQIHICCQNVESRSRQEQVNYKITEFFIDAGLSGRQKDRPAFYRLRRGIRMGTLKFVSIKELSRLTRDVHTWIDFFTECQNQKGEIIIPGYPLDLNTPTMTLQLHTNAAMAQYESDVTSQRISSSVRSAMVTSGKLNSTHQVLGLKQKVRDGQRIPGFYEPDESELKIVNLIMRKFVEYGSHHKLLEYLNEHQILNKGGKAFKRHSLHTLLTNPKYIGKWYLNRQNKDKDQAQLKQDEKYREIELPHGCVVDIELWNSVQNILKRTGKMGKNTRVKRVFPLSGGLLQFQDGTRFRGFSGTGRNTKFFYYLNPVHQIMLRTELIEQATIKVVSEIIENSPSLQQAIRNASVRSKDNIESLQGHLDSLKTTLGNLDAEKEMAKKRLSILLTAQCTPEEIQELKDDYVNESKKIQNERLRLELIVKETEESLAQLRSTSFSWQSIAKSALSTQQVILEQDPVALKNSLYALFKRIVVGPENEMGQRQVTYVLHNPLDHEERSYCFREEMVDLGTG